MFEKTSKFRCQFLSFFRIFRTWKNTHFPALAAFEPKECTCMMAKRIAAFGNKEFLTISINIDKLTGFFDKFLKMESARIGAWRGLFRWRDDVY